ncbi:MAG: AraC family transcriptional regulator [bacterium]|nr:AraC family transcriptional regulator [bacterium]
MDALKYVLHAVRIKPQPFEYGEMTGNWQLSRNTTRGTTFHFVEQGTCLLQLDDNEPILLATGDLVVISNTKHYQLLPINPTSGTTMFVHGEFRAEQNIVYPIFSLLPTLIHVPNQDGQPILWLSMAFRGINSESEGKRPGYEAVISRLMDVLFIMVMRSWIDQHQTGEGGWLGALYDPNIGKVLHAIHGRPDYHWTLERLAQIAMMSRSTFVERFTSMVSEPPMKYLTRWRVQLATTWLGDDDTITLEQIAHRLGYSSSFAFSKTFKRFIGVSPNHFRQMGKLDDSGVSALTVTG